MSKQVNSVMNALEQALEALEKYEVRDDIQHEVGIQDATAALKEAISGMDTFKRQSEPVAVVDERQFGIRWLTDYRPPVGTNLFTSGRSHAILHRRIDMSNPSDFCIGCMNDEYPEGLRNEIESLSQQLTESQTKLVECQAREKVRSKALIAINEARTDAMKGNAAELVHAAIAMPSDSTALDSAIREAQEPLYERIRSLEESLSNSVNADWHNEAIKQAKRGALLEAAESFTCKTYGLMPHDLHSMADELK